MKNDIRLGPQEPPEPSHQRERNKPIPELTAEQWYKERDSMTDLALKQSGVKTTEPKEESQGKELSEKAKADEMIELSRENTRLRELLTKAKDYIFLGYVGAVELSDEIDNALNPKP